jgi:thioredoxin 1
MHLSHVDEQSFSREVLEAEVPVLVEFGAKWCGPCRSLEPVLERMEAESGGRFKVAKVDIDDVPSLVSRYAVRGAPTLIVFSGGQEKGRHLGLTRQETIAAMIANAAR